MTILPRISTQQITICLCFSLPNLHRYWQIPGTHRNRTSEASKVRPAVQFRPAKSFHLACEDILSIIHHNEKYEKLLIWKNETFPKRITSHYVRYPTLELLCVIAYVVLGQESVQTLAVHDLRYLTCCRISNNVSRCDARNINSLLVFIILLFPKWVWSQW